MTCCGCSPFSPPPTPSGSVAPLSRELYVDQGTATPGPSQDGSIGAPFSTIAAAVAAASATCTIRVQPYNYTAEAAQTLGGKDLTFIGEGRSASLPAFDGAGSITVIRATVASVGATTAVTNCRLEDATCTGNVHVTTTLRGQNCSVSNAAGTVVVDGTGGANVQFVTSSLFGTWTITGGGTGQTNAPQIDEHTLSSLGFNGVRRSDGSPDWNVTHQLFAHMQDANRTIDFLYTGAVISTSTLTATRTLTVDQTFVPVGQWVRFDRYDQTTNTVTVSGSSAGSVNLTNASSRRYRYRLANNAGPTIAFQWLEPLLGL